MKKSKYLFILMLSAIFYTPAFAAYELVWQDNFDSFNTTAWSYETGWGSSGWGNNEQEWYTNSNKNVYTENGKLVIKAIRENTYTSQQSRCIFTSGRIKTAAKVYAKYGKIEALIKCPDAGKGVWPAFWMLGNSVNSGTSWPYCGEIDIMEQRGSIPNTVMATWHWNLGSTYNHASWGGSKDVGSALGSAYRIYGMEWTPTMLTGYLSNEDGSNRIDYAWMDISNASNGLETFHNDFFIILNLAMGGNFDGDIADDGINERSMFVDWVRIYQDKTAYPGSTFTNNSTIGTNPPISITGPVTFFKDCNFGGTAVSLPVGDYTLANLNSYGIVNNDISSLKVPAGYVAILYMEDNFTGSSTTITGNDDCLVDNGWNDQTTSLKIRPNGVSGMNGTYTLQNRNSGMFMDLDNGGTIDGTNIHQWPESGSINQQFAFTELGNGVYNVFCVKTGKSVDVNAISTENFANIQQWTYYGTDNQKFILVATDNGYYKLKPLHSGKLIEVGYAGTTAGDNINQYDDNGQTCGQWKLIPTSTASWSTKIEAENYTSMSGVATEATTDTDGGSNVGWIEANDWMAYNTINFPATGTYTFQFRVASPGGATLSADLNAGSIILGSVTFPGTGGLQSWNTVSFAANVNAGTYNLGVFATTGGWNFNWIKITQGTAVSNVIEEATGINKQSDNDDIKVLSRNNSLEISGMNTEQNNINVFDLNGVLVLNSRNNSGTASLDITSLQSGMFFLRISTAAYNYTTKFIKQ